MFFDFEQHQYIYLIQKESMDPSIFDVRNRNIFNFLAKMFFLQSRQMKVSSYIAVRYKNV